MNYDDLTNLIEILKNTNKFPEIRYNLAKALKSPIFNKNRKKNKDVKELFNLLHGTLLFILE